ncbi:hypothetical protein GCM10011391_15480 [Pullulanibacillus camelliae]|uniref:Uncharacterized protein n=1 Tax=Pullulanibacillus camelliae TaxID=1707096 RepID=A0A8J2YGQ8_9BACL|nr:hypothetical protein [Pullulanibacillus camelliae]GGE37493.1 hypothetical protein GCM10011391_15480 [Pullulanibacillus camelliae]
MKQRKRALILSLIVFCLLLACIGYIFYKHMPRQQAVQEVKTFYDSEQDGDYAKAWESLHPLMHKKFSQRQYIQARSQLFIEALGAKTFTYKITEVDHLNHWKMAKDAPHLKNVYRITVQQHFKGIFGQTLIEKEIFAVKTKENYKLLWDYD